MVAFLGEASRKRESLRLHRLNKEEEEVVVVVVVVVVVLVPTLHCDIGLLSLQRQGAAPRRTSGAIGSHARLL